MFGSKTLAGSIVAVVALLATTTMQAQFSGPGLNVTPSANVPLTPTADPAALNPSQPDQQINSGDVLVVRIFGQPDFAPPVRVSVAGTISLPLIGVVPIAGLTVIRAEDLIAERLVTAGMYKNPQVSIQIAESVGQFATVGGELHAVVPVNGDRRLLEVLAAAGSLPPTASHVVTILRPGVEKPIVVDLGTDPNQSAQANIRILPRDTILISRVGVVYVVGAFKQQGAIPLQQTSPLTLMQATALSGGPGYEGKFSDLHIIRTVGLERKLVRVDIGKVMRGTAPDPVLQADDIIFLPTNALKAAIKSGGIGTITGIASILVVGLRP
jgi:polysaccharide export outer membrane protein